MTQLEDERSNRLPKERVSHLRSHTSVSLTIIKSRTLSRLNIEIVKLGCILLNVLKELLMCLYYGTVPARGDEKRSIMGSILDPLRSSKY